MCEPILKDSKLVRDGRDSEGFIDNAKQMMVDAKKILLDDVENEEQTLEYIAPPNPWPGAEIDVNCE